MKKVFALCFTALLFLSCINGKISRNRELYEMYFQETLKDPSSFVVYNESFEEESSVVIKWKVEYGAKNSFGGMVRETVEFTTIGGYAIRINDSYWKLEDDKLIKVY